MAYPKPSIVWNFLFLSISMVVGAIDTPSKSLASPSAKEAAKGLTDSNNEDGVAKAIARYVLEAR